MVRFSFPIDFKYIFSIKSIMQTFYTVNKNALGMETKILSQNRTIQKLDLKCIVSRQIRYKIINTKNLNLHAHKSTCSI